MTTSLLQPPGGKLRARKDLSASSIPTLVALEEEEQQQQQQCNGSNQTTTVESSSPPTADQMRKYSDSNLPSATVYVNIKESHKVKASRRSSLGLGLLGGGGGKGDSNKNGKRRSSMVAFLGRRNSKVCREFVVVVQ